MRHIPLALMLGLCPADAFELEWPVACTVGQDCWVQQYPDHDKSSGNADYTCGAQSYDGHDGTDIRLRTTRETANVLAAAAGTVTGVRDGVPDRLLKTGADRAVIANIECGNGVLIDHGNGWETQYCHLKRGSLAVKRGDPVSVRQVLGAVGYSGDAGFPHLHLSVRKDGETVDPFSGSLSNPCDAADVGIWSPAVGSQIVYADRTLLQLGFSDRKVELNDLETGSVPHLALKRSTAALVGFGWVINLKAADQITVIVFGPQGEIVRNTTTLDRPKAQYLLFAGKKVPSTGWQPGAYRVRFIVSAAGKEQLSEELRFDLR